MQLHDRPINKIIIHCAATPEGRPDTIDDIRRWHVQGNGWRDVGYHYVIHLDGSVHAGRPESEEGAHTSGHNADSIGVCYIGGMTADMTAPKDTRTPEQKAALKTLVSGLLERYPGAAVYGHSDFATKACPSFNVHSELWRLPEVPPAPGTEPSPAGRLRDIANDLLRLAEDLS